MGNNSLGYNRAPKNSNGIIRSKTTGLLRVWLFEKSLKQLEKINQVEWGKIEYPSIYILFDKRKIYIGEAKSVYSRTKTHITNPELKIKNWAKIMIINDGRPATQSDFNDIVVRRSIESYLIKLFKQNNYKVVSQSSDQSLTSIQKTAVDNIKNELDFLLIAENLIDKLLPAFGQEKIHRDDLRKLIEKYGKSIDEWGAHDAVIDGVKVFIRPGSPKEKGWQVTFRDKFKDALKKGDGALLIRRGNAPIIPFKEIQKVVRDPSKYDQNTIDVYIQFSEGSNTLSYIDETIEISDYFLKK